MRAEQDREQNKSRIAAHEELENFRRPREAFAQCSKHRWHQPCLTQPHPHTPSPAPPRSFPASRPHPPHTECRVVRNVDKNRRGDPDSGYLVDCTEGEPGLIITRGGHIMSGYVGDDAATAEAIHEGGW